MGPRAQVPARSAERRRLREFPAAVRVVVSRYLLVLAVAARFETATAAHGRRDLRRGPGSLGPVVDVRPEPRRGDAAARARLFLAVYAALRGLYISVPRQSRLRPMTRTMLAPVRADGLPRPPHVRRHTLIGITVRGHALCFTRYEPLRMALTWFTRRRRGSSTRPSPARTRRSRTSSTRCTSG